MMKIKILLSFILTVLVISSSAQKAKVTAAYNYYKEPYQQYDKAKEAIDEAAQHEQTSNSEKTWYYRGLIYSALYKNEKYGSLCNNCLKTAYESFNKSITLNAKGEYAAEIKSYRIPWIKNKIFDQGVESFNKQDFKQSLYYFEEILTIDPTDTVAVKNSAYSAERAGDVEKTKYYYSRLIEIGLTTPDNYISLANVYKTSDKQKALEIIQAGRKANPDTLSLIYSEINLLLETNRSEEAAQVISIAIDKDPLNESLYIVLGNNYDKLANPKDEQGNSLPKPANSAELTEKAIAVYTKGLSMIPNSYGLNFNLGAHYFNTAAEMVNESNRMKSEKESNAKKADALKTMKEAQPYLEKALETNPKLTAEDNSIYEATLTSLKELYARTNQTEKYNQLSNSTR